MNLVTLINEYGLEVFILALIINVLVGVIKLPIKSWAQKAKDPESITRYIVFLPIIIGFGVVAAYIKIRFGDIHFDAYYISLSLASSSLSLTIYALLEKFFPSKDAAEEKRIIEENKKLIDELKNVVFGSQKDETLTSEVGSKIVLTSNQEQTKKINGD